MLCADACAGGGGSDTNKRRHRRALCPSGLIHKIIIMQYEDDLQSLSRVVHLLRGIAITFLLLHLYWFAYEWFEGIGCTFHIFDRLLLGLAQGTGLFAAV